MYVTVISGDTNCKKKHVIADFREKEYLLACLDFLASLQHEKSDVKS